MAEAGALRAARFGTNLLPQGERARSLDPWLAKLKEEGRDPAAHRIGIIKSCLVTDDRERDWAMLFPELRYMRRQYGAWGNPQQPGELMPAYLERLESDIEAKLKNLVMGTGKEVAAKLKEFEALGFGLIVCRSQFGNLPRADLRRAIEALGTLTA